MRNWKEKEYLYDYRLIFEVEYLNIKKRKGKENEHYIDNIKKFRGEYSKNEKKWIWKRIL